MDVSDGRAKDSSEVVWTAKPNKPASKSLALYCHYSSVMNHFFLLIVSNWEWLVLAAACPASPLPEMYTLAADFLGVELTLTNASPVWRDV